MANPTDTEKLDSIVSKLIDTLNEYVNSDGATNSMAVSYGKIKTLYELVEPVLMPDGRTVNRDMVKALIYLEENDGGNEEYRRMVRLKTFLKSQEIDFNHFAAIENITAHVESVARGYHAYDRHYIQKLNRGVPARSG